MDMTFKTTELDKLWKRGQELLGVRFPIMCGAMTWVSEPNLVSKVCNAGAYYEMVAGGIPLE